MVTLALYVNRRYSWSRRLLWYGGVGPAMLLPGTWRGHLPLPSIFAPAQLRFCKSGRLGNPRPVFGLLCQAVIRVSDVQHRAFGFRIMQRLCDRPRLLRPLTQMLRIVT